LDNFETPPNRTSAEKKKTPETDLDLTHTAAEKEGG
jgi:hypothetical protein